MSRYPLPPTDPRTDRSAYVSTLLRPGDIGAEIGTWQGSFAYHTLIKRQPSKLFLIDPWIGAASDPDGGLQTLNAQRARNDIHESVCDAFASYPNVVVMRMKSEDAASRFDDGFFDYVYIDGDHSYGGVMMDLLKFFPKIKIGGLVIGDDYGWGDVSVAVQDFVKAHKNRLSWMGDPIQKPREGQFVFRRTST